MNNTTFSSSFPSDHWCSGVKLLTYTNWEESRPIVVLLADPYRGANEPESRIALVNHCVSVAKVFSDHLPIDNLLWNTTVTGWRMVEKNNTQCCKYVLSLRFAYSLSFFHLNIVISLVTET